MTAHQSQTCSWTFKRWAVPYINEEGKQLKKTTFFTSKRKTQALFQQYVGLRHFKDRHRRRFVLYYRWWVVFTLTGVFYLKTISHQLSTSDNWYMKQHLLIEQKTEKPQKNRKKQSCYLNRSNSQRAVDSTLIGSNSNFIRLESASQIVIRVKPSPVFEKRTRKSR